MNIPVELLIEMENNKEKNNEQRAFLYIEWQPDHNQPRHKYGCHKYGDGRADEHRDGLEEENRGVIHIPLHD